MVGRKRAIFSVVVVFVSTSVAQSTALWFGLEPGPHGVGFEVVYVLDDSRDWCGEMPDCDLEGRPQRICLWYPSVPETGSPMVLGDLTEFNPPDPRFHYFNQTLDQKAKSTLERQFFSSDRDTLATRLSKESLKAERNARRAEGRFPIVIHSLGRNNYQAESTVLWEYLASHGYLVAVVAQNGPSAEKHRLSFAEEDLHIQAEDILFAADHLGGGPVNDDESFAVIGHSSGAVAAYLASETPRLKAIVSLDGSITTSDGRDLLQATGWKSKTRASLLNVYVAGKKSLDLWAVEQSHTTDRYSFAVQDAIHFDFQNWPLYNALYGVTEQRSGAVRTVDRGRDVFLATVRLTRLFLDSEMKYQAKARTQLAKGPWPAAFQGALASFSFEPAAPLLPAPHGRSSVRDSSTEGWLEDSAELTKALSELHPRVDWVTPRQDFNWQARHILTDIRMATNNESRIVALIKLIATVRDGHTVLASSSRYERLGWLPFSASWHADGIFIRRVQESHAAALGGKILSIDGVPIDLVLGQLRQVVPHATESRFRRWAPSYLHLPGVLFGLGITNSPTEAALEIEGRGRTVETYVFRHVPEDEENALVTISIDEELESKLLRFREPDRLYRLELLPSARALYVAYRRVGVDEQEDPWQFANRIVEALEKHREVERLVVDLRDNGGGGYQYIAHLGPILARQVRINRPGGLYILIGRRTFSAAILWSNWLRQNTAAIFVGESAGDRPVSPGDDDPFTLKNSGLTVNISRVYHRSTFPDDDREAWTPDLTVPERMSDLLAGRDLALSAALRHRVAPARPVQFENQWLGRYAYDRDVDLVITEEEGRITATATPRLRIDLRQLGKRKFGTPVGLILNFAQDGKSLMLESPEGQSRQLVRLPDDRRTGWELFLQGRYEEAEEAFRQVLKESPAHPALSDSALTSEAIHLVFRVRPELGVQASREVGARLLRMGIRLHPEGAPACEFSLRFYE